MLRRIRFHDLRHTAATLPLEHGIELVAIKGLLGHAHAHARLRLQRQAIEPSATRSAHLRTLATRQAQDPSADVAISVTVKTPRRPH
ncbi:hypothetical protein [Kitasatospora cineracea]|uniref:hypothetical protein n=1 Tax=Kitasatospora cineracea TaxID=88074 RepID=UPI0037F9B9C0